MPKIEPSWISAAIGVVVFFAGAIWAWHRREARNEAYGPAIDNLTKTVAGIESRQDRLEGRLNTIEEVCLKRGHRDG